MKANKWLDEYRQALSIDSSISNGTGDYVQFLTQMAKNLGLKTSLMPYHYKDIEFHNLLIAADKIWQNKNGLIDYLFINPLDTDNPGPFRAWSEMGEDPFESMVKTGRLYGLGANSGKLNSLMQLKALSSLPQDQVKKVAILGTYGREFRSYGVLKFLRENKAKIKNIIIGFPTSNKVVAAQAGRIRMRISLPFSEDEKKLKKQHDVTENSSSQSQYFSYKTYEDHKGVWKTNTIVQSFEFLSQLPEQIVILDLEGGKDMSSEPRSTLVEFDLVSDIQDPMSVKLRRLYSYLGDLHIDFEKAQNSQFAPRSPEINFGRIICDFDQIEIYGECVFPPGLPTKTSEKWMEGLKSYIESLGGESKILSQRYPYLYEGNEIFLENLNQISGQSKNGALPYTTEADLFKLAGYNPVIYGAGELNRLSIANEFVELESMNRAEEFYKDLIQIN